MDMSKKLLGAEHPDTVTSMADLASTYAKEGRKDEADHLKLEVINIRRRT
jgi:hypothetical protein